METRKLVHTFQNQTDQKFLALFFDDANFA